MLLFCVVLLLLWLLLAVLYPPKTHSSAEYTQRFSGKVVWVTGASSGIGKAIAQLMYRSGARVIMSSRREQSLIEARKSIVDPSSATPVPIILPLDLEDHDSLAGKAQKALDAFGKGAGVDVVVHNGGISTRAVAMKTSVQVDKRIMDINYFGAMILTKELLPHMMERNSGNVVIVSSVQGKLFVPCRAAYSASKHALHGFFDALRAELTAASYDIGIHTVCPGYVNTNISFNALMADGSTHNQQTAGHEDGYSPEYVAKATMSAVISNRLDTDVAQPKARLGIIVKFLSPWLINLLMARRSRADVAKGMRHKEGK